MTSAAVSCIIGLVLFVASFLYIMVWRSKGREEMPRLQDLIVCYRFVSGTFISLLVPLFWEASSDGRPVITPITSYDSGSSWNFGWGRPVMHFCLAFVGFFLDYHSVARLCCVVGMTLAIVFDTLSSYDLGTQIDCVESGRCALPEYYSLWGLRLLRWRDFTSVVLATWGLILVGYICLVIGVCRIRYSFRQLHAGDHNRVSVMRRELAKRSARNRDEDRIL